MYKILLVLSMTIFCVACIKVNVTKMPKRTEADYCQYGTSYYIVCDSTFSNKQKALLLMEELEEAQFDGVKLYIYEQGYHDGNIAKPCPPDIHMDIPKCYRVTGSKDVHICQ